MKKTQTVWIFPLRKFPVAITRSFTCPRLHCHAYYEFVYVVEGRLIHVLNGERYILEKGNYFLLSPKDTHTYEYFGDSGFSILNICFSPALIDSAFDLETPFSDIVRHHSIGISLKGKEFPFGAAFICEDDSMLNLVTNAFNENKKQAKGCDKVLKYSVLTMLVKLLRNVVPVSDDNKGKDFIAEIIKYVNENYASDIVLAHICQKMGYNAQYVSRSFKEQMGINFTSYLHNVRMQKACTLLLSTDMSVAQISYSVGYENTAYFHRTFKKIIGDTPHNFKNKQC